MVYFFEVQRKRKVEEIDSANRIQFRAPRIFKAGLKKLAVQRNTTISRILRAYIRHGLEKDGVSINLPLEPEGYFAEWMRK